MRSMWCRGQIYPAVCNIPAVVVSQAPIDFEDLAKEGVKTALVMPPPDKIRTQGGVIGDRIRRHQRADTDTVRRWQMSSEK